MATGTRWLMVPLETKVRELDGKALFAFSAAERGWSTMLGRFSPHHRGQLPCGLWVLKGVPPGSVRSLRILRDGGHRMVSWCEEGLVYHSVEDYARRKVEKAAWDLLDLFFAWGPHHARDLVEGIGCDGGRLLVTGHPRFDLLRPEYRRAFADRAARLRRRHGPFILVNTKLNRYNSFFGTEWYANRMRTIHADDRAAADADTAGCVEFQRQTFLGFIDAVRALSRRFPRTRVIVRPHPSEDHTPWRALAAELPNVRVIFEGNVLEWLLAAAVTIQNNCTTAVESFLLGRPTLAYRPVRSTPFDMALPNAVSASAFTLDSLLDLTSRALDGEPPRTPGGDAAALDTVRGYATGVDGPSACETILDAIEPLAVARSSGPLAPFDRQEADAAPLRGTERFYGAAGAARYQSYLEQKCDGLAPDHIVDFLETLRAVTGRFAGVRVTALDRDLLCISA